MSQQDQRKHPSGPNRSGNKRPSSGPNRSGGKKTPARPSKRANTGCLSGILYFLFVVGVSALLAGFGWMTANEVLGLTKPEGQVIVAIHEDDTLSDITAELFDKELIQYPWLFKLFANITHAREKIIPGTYTMDTDLDYMAIVGAMKRNSQYRTVVKVVIPEGFTLKQIFARLDENGVCSEEILWQTARTETFGYSYLEELPEADNRLEGYLFPDTYEFYMDENPKDVLSKMVSNFDRKFTENMRARATEMDLTIQQVVTIAALIEREAANSEEAPMIASVIHNRLKSSRYPYLQIDAAILYVLPEHKTVLTDVEKAVDSPYNTYLYKGLPPGPICSPGKSSLTAVLDPNDTGYYFYAINKDGIHQFSKTYDEHQIVVNQARAARD